MNVTYTRRRIDPWLVVTGLAAAVTTVAVYLAYGLAVSAAHVVLSSVVFWALETHLSRTATHYVPVSRP